MSKNIYRVNKKSDLDEIIKNNFYKPICLIFVSKSADAKLYNDITVSLLAISKEQQYNMLVIIDFDDFIDNINYFGSIKDNTPYFISYFKGKTINMCDNKENFIPLVINHLEKIHTSYINKLIAAFNQTNDIINNDKEVKSTINQDEEVNSKGNNKNINEIEKDNENEENNDDENDEDVNEDEEDQDEEEVEEEVEEEEEEVEEEVEEVVEVVDEEEDKEENETKYINKEKEKLKKLKELKKLRDMLEK